MKIDRLTEVASGASAIRRVLRLQPADGEGGYVAPPTYAADDEPVHAFETRRIGGRDVRCVLLDSVQSQANRLEAALRKSVERGGPPVPMTYVDFAGTPIEDVGRVSALDASHRIFDAIVRDSHIGGTPFPDTPMGRAVYAATPRDATALFRYSPTTLVFGGWNAAGERGGNGPRFPRCIVSEIVGVGVPEGGPGSAGGKAPCASPESKDDPLRIGGVDIYAPGGAGHLWSMEGSDGDAKIRPSKANHGILPAIIRARGVTVDYARQSAVVSLAGIRGLSFPGGNGRASEERDAAARTALAALALYAVTSSDAAGHCLRSRCLLAPEAGTDTSEFEVVRTDGGIDAERVTHGDAARLLGEAAAMAGELGLAWEAEPVVLAPQEKLVELVLKSRAKTVRGA